MKLSDLRQAVAGNAAGFRSRVRLQPAGGEGDKVFPPTYSEATYAKEKRRVPGHADPVECVLLDSVQSQANRIEEALQDAVDEGRIQIPVVEVDFSDVPVVDPGAEAEGLYEPIGRVTSLEAPHRVADAILRDSELDGVPFRNTPLGKKNWNGESSKRDSTVRNLPNSVASGHLGFHRAKGWTGNKISASDGIRNYRCERQLWNKNQ